MRKAVPVCRVEAVEDIPKRVLWKKGCFFGKNIGKSLQEGNKKHWEEKACCSIGGSMRNWYSCGVSTDECGWRIKINQEAFSNHFR